MVVACGLGPRLGAAYGTGGGVDFSRSVPSTALISDDLDIQTAPVDILLFVAVLFIYGRTFYRAEFYLS